MPHVLRTVIPRIKRSLRERGVLASMRRGFLLPFHLLQEYRRGRTLAPGSEPSEFDRTFGVDTDGDLDDWTYLSDLDIPSPNWIEGTDYSPIHPERLLGILSSIPLQHEDFVFVDFGSGKGRALLVASQFPFRKIIGVEFSPELHAIAGQNVARYRNPAQRCTNIQCICMDFARFPLPPEPAVFYFFDPCDAAVLAQVLDNLENSLREHPREIFIVYAAPRLQRLMDSAGFLKKVATNEQFQFSLYRNKTAG
jgi:SAM-dependent methyltransferase